MGLIEDNGAALRQHTRIRRRFGGPLDRQVGKEEVMIHDDDVALSGAPTHFGDKAALELSTLLPQAGLGTSIEFLPEPAALGQAGQFRPVSGFRALLPVQDHAKLFHFLQSCQHRLAGKVIEFLAAKIVIASLHVADAQLTFAIRKHGSFEKRHILEKELFLQRLGSSRDNDAFAGPQDGNQVGQGLPGARSRLDNQMAFFLKCLFHRLGHLQLPLAEFIGWMGTRQQASRPEKAVQRLLQGHRKHKLGCGGHVIHIIVVGLTHSEDRRPTTRSRRQRNAHCGASAATVHHCYRRAP